MGGWMSGFIGSLEGLVDHLIEQSQDAFGARLKLIADRFQVAFRALEPVRQMEARKNGNARGVRVCGSCSDAGDQLVNLLREFDHFAIVTRSEQSKGLVRDVDTNRTPFL